MRLKWPFRKTYNVKCPDGSVKTVYKKVDDAFPLLLSGWEGKVGVSADVLKKVNADLEAEYASKVHGLLFSLDEVNQDLMMSFRGAYITFQSDPCGAAEFLQREMKKLLEEQIRLRTRKVAIDGLIELAKGGDAQREEFLKVFMSIVDNMATMQLPEATTAEIEEARKNARELAGEDSDE